MAELSQLARPYAKALFKLASETDTIEQWSGLLDSLSALFEDGEIVAALANPAVDHRVKASWFEQVCAKAGDMAGRFIQLLAGNGRLLLMPNIRDMFNDYVHQQAQSEEVSLFTAHELNQAQLQDIQEKLMKRMNKNISLVQQRDTSLIGGVRIQGKSWVIDASIAGQLRDLARTLTV